MAQQMRGEAKKKNSDYDEALLSVEEREKKYNFGEINADGVTAKVGKGGSSEKLPREIMVLDTGQPKTPPLEMRKPKTQEELDDVYRWTIKNQGVVDHHGIDVSVLDLPEGLERKCAAKMVADFPEEIIAQFKERNVKEVTAHFDSDLDSMTASYLAKSLLESGKLPPLAKQLAEHVNLVDYGRFRESDPDKYMNSLIGVFGSLKTELMKRNRTESGAIWGNQTLSLDDKKKQSGAINETYQTRLTKAVFEILNACGKKVADGEEVDFTNLDTDSMELSEPVLEALKLGKERAKKEFEIFNREFENAEKRTFPVTNKEGKMMDVPVLIFGETELNPLVVTNLAYTRTSPETIVAVYAGADRKQGGDNYDIGIKPETLDVFNLNFLEAPLNETEAVRRGPELIKLHEKKAAGTLTADEQKLLDSWSKLRQGKEYLGIGDPTVAVAGGSLIAASTTSRLSREDFTSTLHQAFEMNRVEKDELTAEQRDLTVEREKKFERARRELAEFGLENNRENQITVVAQMETRQLPKGFESVYVAMDARKEALKKGDAEALRVAEEKLKKEMKENNVGGIVHSEGTAVWDHARLALENVQKMPGLSESEKKDRKLMMLYHDLGKTEVFWSEANKKQNAKHAEKGELHSAMIGHADARTEAIRYGLGKNGISGAKLEAFTLVIKHHMETSLLKQDPKKTVKLFDGFGPDEASRREIVKLLTDVLSIDGEATEQIKLQGENLVSTKNEGKLAPRLDAVWSKYEEGKKIVAAEKKAVEDEGKRMLLEAEIFGQGKSATNYLREERNIQPGPEMGKTLKRIRKIIEDNSKLPPAEIKKLLDAETI